MIKTPCKQWDSTESWRPTPELNSAEKGNKTGKTRKKEVGKAGGQQPQPCQGRHPENTNVRENFEFSIFVPALQDPKGLREQKQPQRA